MDEIRIIPDDTYPAMFRVHWPDGVISGMANITRCRDAIECYTKGLKREDRDRRTKQRKALQIKRK